MRGKLWRMSQCARQILSTLKHKVAFTPLAGWSLGRRSTFWGRRLSLGYWQLVFGLEWMFRVACISLLRADGWIFVTMRVIFLQTGFNLNCIKRDGGLTSIHDKQMSIRWVHIPHKVLKMLQPKVENLCSHPCLGLDCHTTSRLTLFLLVSCFTLAFGMCWPAAFTLLRIQTHEWLNTMGLHHCWSYVCA